MKKFVLLFMLAAVQVFSQEPVKIISGDGNNLFYAPSYSPDGSMIAFTSEKYKGLWVYSFTDNSVKQVTDEPSAGFGCSWSQDSRSILTRVAKFEDMNRLNAVKIFDVTTCDAVNLSGYQTFMPSLPQWSNGDSKVTILTKKLETYSTGKISKAGSVQKTAFINKNKISVGNVLTNDLKTFEPVEGEYLVVSLSPDGNKILFQVMSKGIFVVNADGTGLVDLGKGYYPKWSPDSKRVVYMISEDDGHYFTSSDIYLINADGTGRIQVTDTSDKLEMNPSFSPDGKSIAFDEFNEGSIYTLRID